MTRKLTYVEINRVDHACMGPARNQQHPHYAWPADRVRRMMNAPKTDPPSLSHLWHRLRQIFPLSKV